MRRIRYRREGEELRVHLCNKGNKCHRERSISSSTLLIDGRHLASSTLLFSPPFLLLMFVRY